MVTIICVIFSHLYSNYLCMFLWSALLGRKYSLKHTAVITFVFTMIGCILKLFLFSKIGLDTITFTCLYAWVTYLVYVLFLFESSKMKRILIATINMILMVLMEVFAMNTVSIVFGDFQLMQLDSWFTIITCIISCMFITVGLLVWQHLWNLIEKVKWESFQYQWLCLFLPLSQWIMILHLTQVYILKIGNYPIVALSGIGLGIVADIYMFYLFCCSNNRAKAEKELRKMNHQYELEKIRYERLKEGQEEVAKVRHDFQNYILTMKNMEDKSCS